MLYTHYFDRCYEISEHVLGLSWNEYSLESQIHMNVRWTVYDNIFIVVWIDLVYIVI